MNSKLIISNLKTAAMMMKRNRNRRKYNIKIQSKKLRQNQENVK